MLPPESNSKWNGGPVPPPEPTKLALCPKCNGEITFGYGLAFGGIGGYRMCLECDWHHKTQDQSP